MCGKPMDISAVVSLVSAIAFIVISIMLGGQLSRYFDPASVMITIGGAVASSFIAYPLNMAVNAIKGAKFAFLKQNSDSAGIIKALVEMSNIARRNGLLSLEESSESLENAFMKKGILLIVDGTDPELIRDILETEIDSMRERHSKVYGYWEKLGELAPAWGMIGTLVGLINMLRNLSDPSTIGPSMAVALITTFYGSVIANMIALPWAAKMKTRSEEEVMLNEIIIAGILSIQSGENPRALENKLKSYLPPKLRLAMDEENKVGEE